MYEKIHLAHMITSYIGEEAMEININMKELAASYEKYSKDLAKFSI